MNNFWKEPFYGYVRVKISGKYVELFMNRCIQYHIQIWEIIRVDNDTIILSMYVKDIKRIRPHLKKTNCKLRFHEKKGFPFLLKRILHSRGFLSGALGFLLVIFVLSNMVWSIDVNGASPEVEHKIRKAIDDIGVKRGKFIFRLPSTQQIQQEITERFKEITWVGVKLQGTSYHFEVVQKQLPEKTPPLSPRHLVAKKKAMITRVFVEQGQPVVKENQFVQKGDLLVSGFIGKEENSKLVAAKGEILGETWHVTEVEIPLKTKFVTNTGDRMDKLSLSLFKLDIPIWGFGKIKYKDYEILLNKNKLHFLKWELPISIERAHYLETEEISRELTTEEAVKLAKDMAKHNLEKQIDESAKIKNQKVLRQEVENGKVKLTIHYDVIEDIGVEKPIIQGD
ncbi:sporulation protein YqfD [Pseudalkalibacillus caeni]|uniref:Sporulation protein YqfD n=1 Tax=Exobacillus caeni TaxID=2574798 RepID=A0A5R9F8J0_9BACL|nr:sporulation protein YqfD [Pseudalkalibacillus caeni]TLS39361.1 sporulation protein YqfD [Pseudalkalibacillus caeni]